MRPVYLIGYMGCGKTTLGRAVARNTSMHLVDLDEYIEEREKMTVRQIFDCHGEKYFRKIERETLLEVSHMTDVIVATGGGTPCQPGLMDIMLETGVTVFLEVSTDVLHRRLVQGRSTRPLIARFSDDELLEYIKTALETRMPYYERATWRFDSSYLETSGQIASSAERFIQQFIDNDQPADSVMQNHQLSH